MKNNGDTKTTAIAVLAIALLVVIVYAARGNLSSPSGAAFIGGSGSAAAEGLATNATRMWPSLAIPPGETPRFSLRAGDVTTQSVGDPLTIQQFEPIDVTPGEVDPIVPKRKVPYVFVTNVSPWDDYTWGPLYYSDGLSAQPEMIYSGDATATYLAGDYCYFINVDDYYVDMQKMPPLIIESTPRRINIHTGQVETLDNMSSSPIAWNYIGASSTKNVYFYARAAFDRQTGELKIFDDGELVYNSTRAHTYPDISDDGRYMTWTEYNGAFPMGEDIVYRYNIQTGFKEMIYQVPDTIFRNNQDFEFYEPNYTHIDNNGSRVAFTEIFFDKANGGALDSVPKLWEGGSTSSLPQGNYRFSMGITMDGAWIFYPVAIYEANNQAIFSYLNGNANTIATWSWSYIEPWVSAGGGTVVYGFDPTITDYLGSFHQQIANYSDHAKMYSFNGKKSNAM
ncbi:hypothetical protein KKE14_01140 [Patescibacteria group bacterium]|nr:hypothetical protein [Patescibacteria group bacterium]